MTEFDHNDNKSKENDEARSYYPSYHMKDTGRKDYPRKTNQEEYAAEVAPPVLGMSSRDEKDSDIREDRDTTTREITETSSTGKAVGYIGVGFGILSLFMWSIVLGPIAAVMGFYAYSQGRKVSGGWSIGLGLLATLSYFILMPMTR